MEPDYGKIVEILQGGGNAALLVAVYFIYKAAHRLSRIEVMMEIILARGQIANGMQFRESDRSKTTAELERLLRGRK